MSRRPLEQAVEGKERIEKKMIEPEHKYPDPLYNFIVVL